MIALRRRIQARPADWTGDGGVVEGGNSLPKGRPVVSRSTFMEDFRRIVSGNVRAKPSYADCWLIGSAGDLDVVEEYDSPCGHVVVGRAADGEMEYNLSPTEYSSSDAANSIVESAIARVREDFRASGGRTDRRYVTAAARRILSESSDAISLSVGGDPARLETEIGRMADIVYRYTVGLGVFDVLLADPKLEDIYIDAPCDRNRIHVTMSGVGRANSHMRCRTNLVVDRREVGNLIGVLKRESGLPYCESSPVLETDMEAQSARATVVGYPMSPLGDAVAIRKRSTRPWTLTRLIANGTLDSPTAGLLSFLVQNRATFLICGARGAGKSSLLSAMMFEFPLSQRILTIEDTIELPSERMREMGYKVQSMLVDDRMEGDSLSRSGEALRVSLRLGESAIVLGEVRGEEARTLYQSMRTGRAGSAILGTIHGDSAKTVYERVVHDMGISPEAFMATDVLVTVGTFRDRATGAQERRVSEVVATTDRPGLFADIAGGRLDFSAPVMRRAMAACSLDERQARDEIRARGMLREFLARTGNRHGEEYFGPEWVEAANEIQARFPDKSPEDLLDAFKARFRQQTGVSAEEERCPVRRARRHPSRGC